MTSMNAKVLASLFILFLLVFTLSNCLATADKIRLVWNDDPTSTMTIGWDQVSGESPTIHYGTTDFNTAVEKYPLSQSPTRVVGPYYEMNTHFATLTNLEPDHNYYFVIKDSDGLTDRYWFRTAPAEPKAFTFIAGGDTKSSDKPLEAGRASNQMVAKLRPLFVLFSGDFNSGDGTYPDRWIQWLTDWQTLTTAQDGRMFPIIPVHGNHEKGNKAILNKIFDAPFQHNDSTNIYYSLSLGKFMHIIVLNSGLEEDGAQREWLEKDLKTRQDHEFIMAAYHKPFYPHTEKKSENDHQYDQWAHLFFKYGLDISFDADSHMSKITYPLRPSEEEGSHQRFIRGDKNGTMFIGEGSWGARPRANNDDKPWTLTSGSFNQIKWLHVLPESEKKNAHIKIYTVITADYDEEENQTTYVENVLPLAEENLFDIPVNINLHKHDATDDYIEYPYSD